MLSARLQNGMPSDNMPDGPWSGFGEDLRTHNYLGTSR